MNVKEEVLNGSKLTMTANSLALTSEIFRDLIEKGYVPHNEEHAIDFMQGIAKASEGLTEMLKEHAAILKAHLELDKM